MLQPDNIPNARIMFNKRMVFFILISPLVKTLFFFVKITNVICEIIITSVIKIKKKVTIVFIVNAWDFGRR